MRILLLSLFLACGMPSMGGAVGPCAGVEEPGYPQGLVVEILEGACAASEFFGDMGVAVLWGYYQDGTLQISYEGRDAVEPSLGRYRVGYGGGQIIVHIEDGV